MKPGEWKRRHEDLLRIALYNAACKYADYVLSDRIDFDEAMSVAKELEDAAVDFAIDFSFAPAGEKQANPPDAGALGTNQDERK